MNDSSLDDEIRAVAFVFVQRLLLRYARRIPAKELSVGIQFHGERVPIWNYQKGIFKPAALGRDGAALSIQTSAESPYADAHDPEAGHFIYKYRGSDPKHPDNVALRNAMLLQRPVIYLVAVDPGAYDAILPVYVTGDDETALQFTLVADQVAALITPAATPVVVARREYVTRAVMQRLHQQQFRRVVLHAYRERCAICRLGHVELLDAAHIVGDKDPHGEPLITNGLGLCKIHHSAFDANIIGIDPDARVHIRGDVLEEIDGPMLRHGLQEINGSVLHLPKKDTDKPDRDLLALRFEQFVAA